MRKWGAVQTEVLGIDCAKKDSQYLKYLLSTAAKKKLFEQQTFIPIGIHLMELSDVLTSLLRSHNQYLSQLTTIDIYNILPKQMH